MKFVAKHLTAIGLLLLASFVTAAAALYWDVPARLTKKSPAPAAPAAHAGCNHSTAAAPVAAAPAAADGAAASDGCCATKANHAPVTAPQGSCTRDLKTATDPSAP